MTVPSDSPGATTAGAASAAAPASREARRRRTEAAILAAARELFASCGYERTTIRGVAGRAGVDPALVMQYYGSKERLFVQASRWAPEHESVRRVPREQVPEAALADLFARFEGPGADREAAVALMRNCLTHPEAARIVRDEVMQEKADAVAATLEGDDAQLRAGLLGACMIGLGMARYLLELEPVSSAAPQEIERLLGPALHALVDPRPTP